MNLIPTSLIIPSLRTSHNKEDVEYNKTQVAKFLEENSNAERLMIHDRLDAVKYYYGDKNEAPWNQKWVVFFLPSGLAYESVIYDSKLMASALKANVLMFNYRGVSHSLGYPKTALDLVEDGAACFSDLIDLGVKVENMMAWAQSIGGGVAAELLARSCYQKAHLVADRTFCDLPTCASKLLRDSWAGSFASSQLRSSGWIFDNVRNIQQIKGAKIVVNTPSDEMIDFSVSLAAKHRNNDEVVVLEKREEFDRDTHAKCLFHTKRQGFKNASEAINRAFAALHPAAAQPPESSSSNNNNNIFKDTYFDVAFEEDIEEASPGLFAIADGDDDFQSAAGSDQSDSPPIEKWEDDE